MQRTAYLLLMLTTLFWGGNAVAGKLAVGHISPFLLTSFRWGFAMVVLILIGHRRLRADWPTARRHLPLLFALGATGFTLFNATMYSALHYTSAINVSIEQAAVPMFIFLANFLLFRTGVTWIQIGGFALTIVGVALTASNGDLARLAGLQVNLGDALMILAIVFYGGYTVALRFKPQLHWQSLMIVLVTSAFIASIPFSLFEWQRDTMILPDLRGWAIAIYAGIFPSILSQVFYIRGVEIIGSNRASLFINLVPIWGTLLSVLVLGEFFQLYHAVALLLVMGGIWIAENSGRKAAAEAFRNP
ncbi:DMT family transporter [Mesorhizobium sp. Z1-4]|uniref:DMT family transporter n=1 Tax=Mesorhizobium sp. Z1-4 TaxID=2448478 RepID=UPI000FDC4581|nr:DMT family transporter [Mesorhizobium sp. Z1-4]